MFMQPRDMMPVKLEEEFSKPVESIMRCEDFKSNFARRLSNRYISRTSVSPPKPDTALKLRPTDKGEAEKGSDNVSERIEQSPQLSKNINMEQNGEAVKPPDKPAVKNSVMKGTEVTVLNMEVETLRWQLAQTEANRQMHIALLKQIVAFLNRVKEHIQCQANESNFHKDVLPARLLPQSFTTADLPRSRSVVHVNKNLEYFLNTPKKMSTRRISKSISSANGFKDSSGVWRQSKLSLTPDGTEASQKITEEITRLITLATTVLSTKIPDLACSCQDKNVDSNHKLPEHKKNIENSTKQFQGSSSTLNQIEEEASKVIAAHMSGGIHSFKNSIENLTHLKGETYNSFKETAASLNGMESNSPVFIKLPDEEKNFTLKGRSGVISTTTKSSVDKNNDFNSSFIEDESGFSSMSSFQEIGIPIISIIPPSPCKEIGFMEEIPNMIDDEEKWKTDNMEIEKQTVKVFWV